MDRSKWSLEKRVINLEKAIVRQRATVVRLYQKIYARTANTRLRASLNKVRNRAMVRAKKVNRLVGSEALHRLSLELSNSKRYKDKSVMFLNRKEKMKLYLFLNSDRRKNNRVRA